MREGRSPLTKVRATLGERLRERLPEIQAAVATRVYSISDPHAVTDPAYPEGLNTALAAAIEHRLATLESGERGAPDVPAVLLAQARLDARDGVALDTVLRRYFAGSAIFGDFVIEEAERAEVPNSDLRRLLGEQSTLGEQLIAAVSDQHAREANRRPRNAAERRRECVKALLAGKLVDSSELGYDLDGHHVALMARGEGAEELVRELAKALDRRLLCVQREEEAKWACWLGGTRPLAAEQVSQALADRVPRGVFVTIGEPAEGLAGWRFGHFQAKAALPAAERKRRSVVRYVDVALLAAVLRDDLLVESLHDLYLEPLERMRDGGRVARETLRAYFAAARNVSSTASALGVDRHTVTNRLRAIEETIERPIGAAALHLQIALQLVE